MICIYINICISPPRGWVSLTMTFTGKFVYIYNTEDIINFFTENSAQYMLIE